ncbi:MAG: hypothetical protein U1E22_02450 [Coriobacteriia bacterium]|nr:hypothetical protein [Coriobacteriia bacterium]
MPDEVIAWLEERISYMGWPPAGDAWYGVMRGRSLDQWAALRWERRVISPHPRDFNRDALLVCESLHDIVFNGIENEYSVIECSHAKVGSIARYVQDKRAIPGTLIFLDDNGLLDLVDGCHRLMFFFALMARGADDSVVDSKINAWVGCSM